MAVFLAAWGVAAGAGFVALERYSTTPGLQTQAAPTWPADSRLNRVENQPTLLVFIHPKCPCSRATLAVLGTVLDEAIVRPRVIFAVWHPPADDRDWGAGPGLEAAATAHHATLWIDRGGTEAIRFHAATSGEVYFYDQTGRLAFHGGVTATRGQVNPGAGAASLAALLRHKPAETATAPAYGCALSPAPCQNLDLCTP